GDDGNGALGLRPEQSLQPGEGLSHAEALWRPPRAVSPPPDRGFGRGLARVTALSRPATLADAILGVRPRVVYEPETIDEAVEVIRDSASFAKRLAFVGGGTELDLGAAPERLDAVIRTGRLGRVVEHAPSDQIVVVEAGRTLATLQETLAS